MRRKAKARRGLYLRGNVWWVRYATLDGQIIRKSTGTTDHGDAVTFLAKCRVEAADGKDPQRRIGNYTFAELAEGYRKFCARQKAAEKKNRYIDQLVARFGNIPLRHISIKLLQEWQSDRLLKGANRKALVKGPDGARVAVELPNTAKPNNPATVNRLLATLKHMITMAVEWSMVEPDVLMRVRKVQKLKESKGKTRFLEPAECQALIEHCRGMLKPMVIIALHTGMRRGEIFKLTWDQVDLRRGMIFLEDTKSGHSREVPLNDSAREAFSLVPCRMDGGRVFSNPKGETYRTINKAFARACRLAGIRGCTFHTLRHTYASHLVMAGVSIKAVQEFLGHQSLAITMRYSHLGPSHKAEAVGKLDTILSGKPDRTAQLLHSSTEAAA